MNTIKTLAKKAVIPVLVIAVGVWAGGSFVRTPKAVKRQPPQLPVPQVNAVGARLTTTPAKVSGMGVVRPAVEISLRARVSGNIIALAPAFIPGGHIKQGALVAQVDPADYEVELEKARSEVEKAQADLAIEEGSQTIAREEFRLLNKKRPNGIEATDLLLRKPQLAQAEAGLHRAEAGLKMAELNLERTRLFSPFNAMIKERHINIGAHVGTQDTIAVLVGTDAFWVSAAIPVDQVAALYTGQQTSPKVRVMSQTGVFDGRLIQITGALSENTRMAEVLIQVDDPLRLASEIPAPGLLLDDYVSVVITGTPLENVVELPRKAIRDNSTVWVFEDGRLAIRPVAPVWQNNDTVYLKDEVHPGELVITSDLSIPVHGMPLSLSPDGAGRTNTAPPGTTDDMPGRDG